MTLTLTLRRTLILTLTLTMTLTLSQPAMDACFTAFDKDEYVIYVWLYLYLIQVLS